MPWHCRFCDSYFTQKNVLEWHTTRCHKSKSDLTHGCNVCGLKFAWFGDLKKHVSACCGSTIRDEVGVQEEGASIQNVEVPVANARRNLAMLQEEKPERVYTDTDRQCEVCGKMMTKSSFRYHSLTHLKEKSFVCDLCGSAFNNVHYLNIHHRRTHAKSRNYKCEICKKGFKSASALRLHGHRAHSTQKPWTCQFCERSFATKHTMQNHVLTHTKERPHQCAMCGRRFTKPDALKVHLRTHTKEKPFTCSTCGKTFSHKVTMVKYHRCPNATSPQTEFGSDGTTILPRPELESDDTTVALGEEFVSVVVQDDLK